MWINNPSLFQNSGVSSKVHFILFLYRNKWELTFLLYSKIVAFPLRYTSSSFPYRNKCALTILPYSRIVAFPLFLKVKQAKRLVTNPTFLVDLKMAERLGWKNPYPACPRFQCTKLYFWCTSQICTSPYLVLSIYSLHQKQVLYLK